MSSSASLSRVGASILCCTAGFWSWLTCLLLASTWHFSFLSSSRSAIMSDSVLLCSTGVWLGLALGPCDSTCCSDSDIAGDVPPGWARPVPVEVPRLSRIGSVTPLLPHTNCHEVEETRRRHTLALSRPTSTSQWHAGLFIALTEFTSVRTNPCQQLLYRTSPIHIFFSPFFFLFSSIHCGSLDCSSIHSLIHIELDTCLHHIYILFFFVIKFTCSTLILQYHPSSNIHHVMSLYSYRCHHSDLHHVTSSHLY